MSDFTVLPVYGGVNKWHFNRFRVVFKLDSRPLSLLATHFVTGFPAYFNNPETAHVELAGEESDGKQTMKFLGFSFLPYPKVNVNVAHHDWVRQERVQLHRGFLAQTLKRDFWETQDDLLSGAGGGLLGAAAAGGTAKVLKLPSGMTWAAAATGGVVGGLAAPFYNSMHFLAGRRSWAIGPGEEVGMPGGFGFIETAAVERFSCTPYLIGDWVLKLEKQIPKIWTVNLTQFIRMSGLKEVWQKPQGPRWDRLGIVDFYQNNNLADVGALYSDPEFRSAAPVHPNLVPPEH